MHLAGSPVVEYHIEIVASISYIKATFYLASNTGNSHLQRPWIWLGHYLCGYNNLPPAFATIRLHHFQGNINFRPDSTCNDAHMSNALLAQPYKEVWCKEHLLIMNKARKIRQ